jgi:hypothetical protein
VLTLRKEDAVYSEMAKEKTKKNEMMMWGLTRGIKIFLQILFLVSLAASIRFLSMFFKPKDIMNMLMGKKENVRRVISEKGLYTSIGRFEKAMSANVPLFPKKPSHENVKM